MKIYRHNNMWIVSSVLEYLGEFTDLGRAMEVAELYRATKADAEANS